MDNSTKYDIILLTLGIIIIVAAIGMALSPTISIVAGVIGIIISGYAMFGIAPTDRKI